METEASIIQNSDETFIRSIIAQKGLCPIVFIKGVYFFGDSENFVHVFCNVETASTKAALACWFGPDHCK